MVKVVQVVKALIAFGILLVAFKLGPFVWVPVALVLAGALWHTFFRRTVGYRLEANQQARQRHWQSKVDSEATAQYDPDYWDRKKAYNQQVGLAASAAPAAPEAQHDLTARLAQLDAAKAAGELSDDEYAKARAAIIASA